MSNRHFTLTSLKVVAPSSLHLVFADGVQLLVKLREIIDRHPSLSALRDPTVFATAVIGEWGGSVVWNNDNNLELAADNLHARGIEQADGYSHELICN